MNYVSTDQAPAAIGPYAQAVTVNGLVYTSGQIALKADGSFLDGTIEEQTEQAFENLKSILQEANSSLSQVVKAMVFIKDMNDFAAMNEVYSKHFGDHTPARSCVEVARLPKDAKVEIEVIALVTE